jgi:hypothetical protein
LSLEVFGMLISGDMLGFFGAIAGLGGALLGGAAAVGGMALGLGSGIIGAVIKGGGLALKGAIGAASAAAASGSSGALLGLGIGSIGASLLGGKPSVPDAPKIQEMPPPPTFEEAGRQEVKRRRGPRPSGRAQTIVAGNLAPQTTGKKKLLGG